MTFLLLVLGACGIISTGCIYMMYRNEWVSKRRMELIHWHFYSGMVDWRLDFDETYGAYDDWMSFRNAFTWDPARLAGLTRWFPGEMER